MNRRNHTSVNLGRRPCRTPSYRKSSGGIGFYGHCSQTEHPQRGITLASA